MNLEIIVNREEISKVMDIANFTATGGRAGVKDTEKLLLLWIKDGDLYFGASCKDLTYAKKVDSTIISENEEDLKDTVIPVRLSEISKIIGLFNSLKKTVVETFKFVFKDKNAYIEVTEAPIDKDLPMAEQYNQVSEYRLNCVDAQTKLNFYREFLNSLDLSGSGESMSTPDFAMLLTLLSSILKNGGSVSRSGNGNYVTVGKRYDPTDSAGIERVVASQTKDGAFTAIPNMLIFENITLTPVAIDFLSKILSATNEDIICNTQATNPQMGTAPSVINVKASNGVYARISLGVFSKVKRLEELYRNVSAGVVVDREYFTEVLNRVRSFGAKIHFHIDVDKANEKAAFTISNEYVMQSIPILSYFGKIDFAWAEEADSMLAAVITGQSGLSDPISIELDENSDDGKSVYMRFKSFGTSGESRLWSTVRAAVPKKISKIEKKWGSM